MPTRRPRIYLTLQDDEVEAIRDLQESTSYVAISDGQAIHALLAAGIQKLNEDRKAAFSRAAGGKR